MMLTQYWARVAATFILTTGLLAAPVNTVAQPADGISALVSAPASAIVVATAPIKIMALGDSLTAGDGDTSFQSYRGHLHQLLSAIGHTVDFVGSQASPNTIEGDEDHEGHFGFTIGPDNSRYCSTVQGELACSPEHYNLYDNVENWLKQNPPDIILLHIGINDLLPQSIPPGGAGIERSADPERAAQRLQALVRRIRSITPTAKIVLSSLTRVSWRDGADWPPYVAINAMARELGQNHADGLYFADLSAIRLNNVDFYDSLHLSNSGAQKIAKAWFEALNPLLQQWTPPIISTPTLVAAPEPQPCEGNLLKNPAFADNLQNWEDWGGATVSNNAHNGNAIQINPSVGGIGGFGQMVPAVAASSYTFSAWAKRTGKPVWAGFGVAFWDSGNSKLAMYSIDEIGSDYANYTLTAVAPWGATRAQVWAWASGESGNLLIDDVCLLPTWMAQRSNVAQNTPTPAPISAQAVAPAAPVAGVTAAPILKAAPKAALVQRAPVYVPAPAKKAVKATPAPRKR